MSLLVKMSLLLVRARRCWISCRRVSMCAVMALSCCSVQLVASGAGASVMFGPVDGGFAVVRVALLKLGLSDPV